MLNLGSHLKSWQTADGSTIARVLSGRSNVYLIQKNNTTVLIDTGKKSALKKLVRNLSLLGIKISDISALVLTHTHFDHCQSACAIRTLSNCRIAVSGATADSVRNGYTGLPQGTMLITRLLAKAGNRLGKRFFGYQAFTPDLSVNEDADIEFKSLKLRVITTPGHSSDSISIIVDNEIAIVGDVMFGVFRNSIFPPYADNVNEMVGSWQKLLQNECRLFLPGHGMEISRNLLIKEYERHSASYNSKL